MQSNNIDCQPWYLPFFGEKLQALIIAISIVMERDVIRASERARGAMNVGRSIVDCTFDKNILKPIEQSAGSS